MKLKKILLGATLAAGLAFSPRAEAINCDAGEKAVTQTITTTEYADDLFAISTYHPEDGGDRPLATGGSGELTQIINTWDVNQESIESNTFDVATKTFEGKGEFVNEQNGTYTLRFCAPLNTTSTTSHAVYKEGTAVRGIFSGVGIINATESDFTLNRATGTWFNKFNEGQENSGAELIRNTIENEYGTRPERTIASQLVLTLNNTYAKQLDATQLRANGTNIDVEGMTVFVEDNNATLCLAPSINSYRIEGVEMLDNDRCIENIEDYIGATTQSKDQQWKTGTIEDARTGSLDDITITCNGDNATATIDLPYNAPNMRVLLEQGNDTYLFEKNNTINVSCVDTDVTLAALGNTEEPLYTRTKRVEVGQTEQYDITVETYVRDNGVSLYAVGHPSEEVIKRVWDWQSIPSTYVRTNEFICREPHGEAVDSVDEIIRNVNGLPTSQKYEFYGESPDGMIPYTNDGDNDGSFCDDDEPDNSYVYLVRLIISEK